MSGCPLFLSPFDAPSFWVRLSVLYAQPHTTRLSLDSCGANCSASCGLRQKHCHLTPVHPFHHLTKSVISHFKEAALSH